MQNVNLASQQRRNYLRQTIVGRSPDAGRSVGHSKMRALSAESAEVFASAEGMGLSVPAAGQLGGSGGVAFLTGWSLVGGSDVL